MTPQFRNSFDNIQFRNFVLNISAVLRYAHDKAILENDTYRLKYREDLRGCRLEKARGNAITQPQEQEFRPVQDRAGAFHTLPPRAEAEIENPDIFLYPDGSASAAEWKFTDAAGHEMTVKVFPESGDVSVEEEDA